MPATESKMKKETGPRELHGCEGRTDSILFDTGKRFNPHDKPQLLVRKEEA